MDEIKLEHFIINEKESFIAGKIIYPKITLPGARIKTSNNSIEGFIYEVFEVTNLDQVKIRCPEISFNIGDWYAKFKITKGIELFLNKEIRIIQIEEPKNNKTHLTKSKASNPRSRLVKLRNMSGNHFSNFYLDVRGGATDGAGKNEHGEAHFHIILYAGNKDLGPVFFPTVEAHKKNKIELEFPDEIDRRMEKEIKKWVFKVDLENLELLNNQWVEMNKDNKNRIIK